MPLAQRGRLGEPREHMGVDGDASERRSASSAIANPTTVGLQVLQRPTPRIAASPSATIFARMPGSSTQLSRGLMMRVSTAGRCSANQLPQLLHEDVGIVEQAVDQIDVLPSRLSGRGASRLPVTFGG